jgi:hypothetical protein
MCVYSERKKPGVRIAYVQELEDKVNRLEAVLHSLGRRVEGKLMSCQSRNGVQSGDINGF